MVVISLSDSVLTFKLLKILITLFNVHILFEGFLKVFANVFLDCFFIGFAEISGVKYASYTKFPRLAPF